MGEINILWFSDIVFCCYIGYYDKHLADCEWWRTKRKEIGSNVNCRDFNGNHSWVYDLSSIISLV